MLSALGCGPCSEADPHHVQLVWATQAGPDCLPWDWSTGLLELQKEVELPPWLSEADLDRIFEIADPYGDNIDDQADCLGRARGPSPYADGGEPLVQLRSALPRLHFEVQALWLGWWKLASWFHARGERV
uniref:Uncharacterized protein n=1 Tax=Alexandrium monilatum TaxID=311494 RepID=A0A7S4R3A7_9DINO